MGIIYRYGSYGRFSNYNYPTYEIEFIIRFILFENDVVIFRKCLFTIIFRFEF